MGGEAKGGSDVCQLPRLHAKRVRKTSQAKQNHRQIGGFGIANSVTDKDIEQIEQLEVQALMIAGEQYAGAESEAVQRNDGDVQSKA